MDYFILAFRFRLAAAMGGHQIGNWAYLGAMGARPDMDRRMGRIAENGARRMSAIRLPEVKIIEF